MNLIEKDMLARCQNLNSSERRRLWLWIKEQQASEILTNSCAKKKKSAKRKDPTVGMSKRQKNIWIKERNRLQREQEARRIGLNLVFREGLPEDSFREMMGFLYK